MAVRAALLVAAALLATAAAAPHVQHYEFEDVRAAYGLSFVADPPANQTESWLSDLAGGPGLPLDVTYGFVELLKDGTWSRSESFVRVSGPGGSRSYFSNGCSFVAAADGATESKGDYSWHKRLANSTFVKDMTPPSSAILFVRMLDADGILASVRFVDFPGLASGAMEPEEQNTYWVEPTAADGMWTARGETMVEAGDRPSWRTVC